MRSYVAAAVLAMSVNGMAQAADFERPVWLTNAADREIVFLYEKPRCCDLWEEDMLGERTFKPGERIQVDLGDFNGECRFTLYVQFQDGERRSWPQFDACKTTEYSLDAATMR